jgi:hypothetical protein
MIRGLATLGNLLKVSMVKRLIAVFTSLAKVHPAVAAVIFAMIVVLVVVGYLLGMERFVLSCLEGLQANQENIWIRCSLI